MLLRSTLPAAATLIALSVAPAVSQAGDASTWVNLGAGFANAGAVANAPFGIARTDSRVGHVNFGRGLAVGMGPNGLSLSHTIGVQDNGFGVGHTFQLSVGPNGTHVGHGGVVTHGANSRVFTGGQTHISPRGPQGGTYAGGTGWHTNAWSRNQTTPSHYPGRYWARRALRGH